MKEFMEKLMLNEFIPSVQNIKVLNILMVSGILLSSTSRKLLDCVDPTVIIMINNDTDLQAQWD